MNFNTIQDELRYIDNKMISEIIGIIDKYSKMKSKVEEEYKKNKKQKKYYESHYGSKKLLIARKKYSEHINRPIEEITNDVLDKTSLGINGWYIEAIKKNES